jgi:peptide/nickel transport system substrate-binding protein/oligopeptide transport system substrate-binding protein
VSGRATRVAACVLAALLAAGCAVPLDPPPAGPPGGDEPPRRGGTLHLAAGEDPKTLDPARGYDTVSWLFEQMLFDTLVTYDEGTNIVPDVAASWETSPDRLRTTFRLRHDVRFSSGRAMTAADVKYSLERLLSRAVHSQGAEFFQGLVGAADFMAGRAPAVAGIATPADDVVEFTLTAPDALFLHKLTMPFASIVDRETVERTGAEGFEREPIGTGAFVLAEWTYGQRLRLARNPHYFRPGLPYLDAVDVTIGVSDQIAWFKYPRGEIDISGIPAAEFARVTSDPRYRPLLLQRTTLSTQYLGLNCGMAPFDRIPVRQAMNLAIDKARIVELLNGRGVPARGVLPPDMPAYDPAFRPYAHDPEAARARLAEAGLGAGFDTVLWASRDDGSMRIAQSIQQDLHAIGVGLRIKPVDFPALIEAVRHPGQVALFLLGWEADFPDPSNFLTVLLHSRSRETNNNTFFADPRVDALLDEADALPPSPRRLALYHEAEVAVMRAAPWVPLVHPKSFVVRHPRVRGYRIHPLRPARLERVWVAW